VAPVHYWRSRCADASPKIDPGDAKQGDDTNHTYAIKNTYYKESVDDKPLLEIDLLNFIYKRNGQNLYPDRIMSALGLGSDNFLHYLCGLLAARENVMSVILSQAD
jgi:hypothetical protein